MVDGSKKTERDSNSDDSESKLPSKKADGSQSHLIPSHKSHK